MAAQPQITPGQNGYLAPLTQSDYGANPWASTPGETEAIQTQVNQGTQNVQNMATAGANYAQQSAPYPSYPNSAGLGSQNAFGAPAVQVDATNAASSSAVSAASATPTDSGSRGFNPWSLRGEAMSR